jgi:signal transduction histidine kinase/CheY-like chemotaxis protein
MKAPPLRVWLIALVAMTACPLVAVFAWLTHSVEQKAEREAHANAHDLAARVAVRADALPVEAERLLWVLGRRHVVRAEARRGGARSPTCDPLINDFAALYAYYANAVAVDRDGTVLCSALPFRPGWTVKDRGWFRELVEEKRLVIGDAVVGPASGRFIVPIAEPLFDAAGNVSGAVGLSIDLVHLTQSLHPAGPMGARILLVDQRGRVLSSSSSEAEIGRDFSADPLVAHALRLPGGGSVDDGPSGSSTINGYAIAAGGRWRVVVSLPAREALAQARRHRALAAQLGLASLLLALTGTGLISLRIARPVRALSATARAASHGLVSDRAPVKGPREIREAALRFNDLLDARTRAEAQLTETAARVEHVNRLLRTGQSIGRMLGRVRGRDAMLEEACRILVEEGGVRGAWIPVPEADGSVRPVAGFGMPPASLVGRCRWDDTPHGNGLVGRALRLGVPGVAHDVHQTPALKPWWAYYTENGIASVAVLPVKVREATVAAIAVYSATSYSFDPDVVELIAEIARELGRTLQQGEDEALRKGAEDALRASEARLIVADRMASVGRLAAGVAHEINNPLAYVIMNTSSALEDLEAAAQLEETPRILARVASSAEALRDAREGSERVRLIVRELSQFSRSHDSSQGPTDLRATIDSAANIAWNEIRQSARLVKDYGACPRVQVNGPRLGQVFLNLLLNAAQAIGPGSPEEHQIRVSTWVEGGRAIAEVRDTGPGVPPELLDRIFEPFFTTKPVGSGTGLGLAICHSIVAEARGELTVRSVRGQGAAFRVALPLARDETLGPKAHAGVSPPPSPRARILVIDDEPAVLSAVQRTLGKQHEVVVQSRAAAAVELIRRGDRFDLVLCDLMMPEMNGIEFCAALDQIERGAGEAVLLMTGGAFGPVAQQLLEQARDRCLEKPFEPAALQEVVRQRLAARA